MKGIHHFYYGWAKWVLLFVSMFDGTQYRKTYACHLAMPEASVGCDALASGTSCS
jgi:hypothetical protein